jgi:hypothetical protein
MQSSLLPALSYSLAFFFTSFEHKQPSKEF